MCEADIERRSRLGDRHCENILLDSNTGDVVHVDFNCLFEKVSYVHNCRSFFDIQPRNLRGKH